MKRLALALTLATVTAVGGGTLAPRPAEANGNMLVFEVNPTTPAEARAVRGALAVVAARQDIRANGRLSDAGAAAIIGAFQNGGGSTAIIQQRGSGHSGSITQRGSNHAYGLFQFGQNTARHVTQQGQGQTGMTVIIGY